jgi:septal ring factor EnvC (AmiA/AmiB activator)
MFKKVLIATLAVVVGLAVVKGSNTWLGSHMCLKFNRARAWMESQIKPEEEIARLRMELDNLAKEDDKHFDTVARQMGDVKKLERNVEAVKKDLGKREVSIRDMREALISNTEQVTFNGTRYDRSDLLEQVRLDARNFQADEDTLKSKEDKLKAMKKSLNINLKKLNDLKVVRQQMATELQKLETALAEERQAQAQANSTLDDASYQRIRKDMDSIRDKIDFLKNKRELKGEASNGPVRISEKQRAEEAKLDKYLETRFGSKKEVVSEK